ncbi:MAG: hypothetical protein ABIE70_09715, partial [bacterium]
RGLAMGGAMVAGPFDGTAAYWNPAGLTRLSGRTVSAMHAETFGSLLNHDFVAYTERRTNPEARLLAYGFYLYYLGGGGIKITGQDPTTDRFYVLREESHADVLLAGSIAGRLGDKLDFGLTAKIIHRDLGTETGKGLTLDIGLLYQAHPNVQLGLAVIDATSGFIRYNGATFDQGSHTESIYPTVKPGIMARRQHHDFVGLMTISGDIKFENLDQAAQWYSGSVSLDSHIGWEIGYKNVVFGRAGFDMGRLTAGAGFVLGPMTLDLAYLHHSELDATYRVSGSYRWGN